MQNKQSTPKSVFWRGYRDCAPFILVAAPFGLLFGVAATELGLDLIQTMTMTVLVIAGAAQFTALILIEEQAPTLIILATALAVNLRMAMYSASLTPYLGQAPLWQRALCAYLTVDQSYVLAIAKYESEPTMTVQQRFRFFMGAVTPVIPLWYAFSFLGALVGGQIPDSWALDFAIPITFLAMIAPMFRTVAHVVAALVAVIVSLFATQIPYSLGLIVAGVLGMMAGAQTEVWLAKKGLPT